MTVPGDYDDAGAEVGDSDGFPNQDVGGGSQSTPAEPPETFDFVDDFTSDAAVERDSIASEVVSDPLFADGDEPTAVVNLEEARARVKGRIAELAKTYSTPVNAGRAPVIGIGFEPPQHFSAADLADEAEKPINWQVQNLWLERAKVLMAAESKAGKCVARDAYGWSTGLRTFGEMYDAKVGAIAAPQQTRAVLGWADDGEREGIRVTLDCGLWTDGSVRHRIWVRKYGFEGWRRLNELTGDEQVAVALERADWGDTVASDAYDLGCKQGDEPVPKRIRLGTRECVAEYLRGLWGRQRGKYLESSCFALLEQVQQLGLGIGVLGYLSKTRDGWRLSWPSRREDKAEREGCHPFCPVAWCRIRSRLPSVVHRVDCEVEEEHAYLANGLVNHNTFCVDAAALALASGRNMFENERLKVKQCPVGIIAAEDDEGETGRRLQRMCRAMGIGLRSLPIHWWPADKIRLNRIRDIEWIADRIREYGIKFMVYDPMARMMDGDENSKECVSQVLSPASELTRKLDCTILIVHHLGKDDPERPKTAAQRVRGSSDIRAWYTTGIFLSGQLSNGRVGVELEQRTSGRIPKEFSIRAEETQDESVFGLGSIKLVARIRDSRADADLGTNQQIIENAADKILQMTLNKAEMGLTTSEIMVNLALGRNVMNAALKILIRERRLLSFEVDKEIPDGKLLLPNLSSGRVPQSMLPTRMRSDVPPTERAAAEAFEQTELPASAPPDAEEGEFFD